MRIFHLSDLHLGLRLMERDLYEDQKYILEQIVDHAKDRQPDVVLIAGDIYDRAVPSAESVDLFDYFISILTKSLPDAHIMMISGNHDSGSRVNLFRNILKKQQVHMIGLPPRFPEDQIEKVVLEDSHGQVAFYLLPFVKPSMVKMITGTDDQGLNLSYDQAIRALLSREEIDESIRNVLVSHQFYIPSGTRPESVIRMDSEIIKVGNVDAVSSDILDPFDYCALGHIHKPMRVGKDTVRYCGTPIACSVSEAGQQKAILMVDLKDKGDLSITELPLTPLREVKKLTGSSDEILSLACDDYVTIVLDEYLDTDLRDRIRDAFPYLLRIERHVEGLKVQSGSIQRQSLTDPFLLCCELLGDIDEESRIILRDVINSVRGGEA